MCRYDISLKRKLHYFGLLWFTTNPQQFEVMEFALYPAVVTVRLSGSDISLANETLTRSFSTRILI